MTLPIFFSAFLLGLSVAAPIGPINIEIIRRALTVRPLAAFFFGLGAVTADCCYLGLALVAAEKARTILDSGWGYSLGLMVGGGMLAWIGWMSVRSKAAPPVVGEERTPISVAQAARGWGTGLMLTLVNPMTVTLWLSVAAGFTASSEMGHPVARLAGVGAGALSWVIFITTLLAFARSYVNARMLRMVNVVSGAVLIVFAIKLWVDAFTR